MAQMAMSQLCPLNVTQNGPKLNLLGAATYTFQFPRVKIKITHFHVIWELLLHWNNFLYEPIIFFDQAAVIFVLTQIRPDT